MGYAHAPGASLFVATLDAEGACPANSSGPDKLFPEPEPVIGPYDDPFN